MSHLQATHLAIRERITVLPLFGTLYVRKTFPGILERKLKNATERIKNSLEWPTIEPLQILPAHLCTQACPPYAYTAKRKYDS
jgi:hypothetical protein